MGGKFQRFYSSWVCVWGAQSLKEGVLTLWNPVDCSLPAPLFMEFSRQGYWSGLPCPPRGDLPDPGIEPTSPALAGRLFATRTTWEALSTYYFFIDKGIFSNYRNFLCRTLFVFFLFSHILRPFVPLWWLYSRGSSASWCGLWNQIDEFSNLAVWHSVLMTSGILLCFFNYKIRTSKIVCISEGCFEPVKAISSWYMINVQFMLVTMIATWLDSSGLF